MLGGLTVILPSAIIYFVFSWLYGVVSNQLMPLATEFAQNMRGCKNYWQLP